MKKKELIGKMAQSSKQFRQIRLLITHTLRNSDKAFTIEQLHSELQRHGYDRNLTTTRRELYRLLYRKQVEIFVAKEGKKKYFFMV